MSVPERPADESAWIKLRWPIAVVLVVALLVGGVLFALVELKRTMVDTLHNVGEQTTNAIHAIGSAAGDALAKFDQRAITRTFQESVPKLSSEPGGRLEIASMTMTESFSESNNLTTGWGKLDLGTTITEIKIPATYRYYVRLRDTWKFDVASNVCLVHAPRFHPFLPPAIDTKGMEKKSVEGWGRFNAGEQMTDLEKNITPTLILYAGDKRHIALVREECRKTVAQFIRDWLLRKNQWRDDRYTTVKVIFPDETNTDIFTVPPSVELKNND